MSDLPEELIALSSELGIEAGLLGIMTNEGEVWEKWRAAHSAALRRIDALIQVGNLDAEVSRLRKKHVSVELRKGHKELSALLDKDYVADLSNVMRGLGSPDMTQRERFATAISSIGWETDPWQSREIFALFETAKKASGRPVASPPWANVTMICEKSGNSSGRPACLLSRLHALSPEEMAIARSAWQSFIATRWP